MATAYKNQFINSTPTQQSHYNQALLRQADLNNQHKYLQVAQISPMFALGNLIGNILVDRYNSRGVNKEKQAISDALAKYNGNNDYSALNGILDRPSIQNSTIPAGETIGMGVGDIGGSMNTQPQGQSIVAPQTSNADTFDLEKFQAQYYEDARRRGRTDAQINEAWASMQPQINALTAKAKDDRVNTALSAFKPDDNGNYSFGQMSLSNPEFIKFMRPLIKDDPTIATFLMKSAAAKDTQKSALEKQAQQNNFRLALADKNNANRLANTNLRVANKQKNTNPTLNIKEIKLIDEQLDRLNKIETGDELSGIKARKLTDTEASYKQKLLRTKQDMIDPVIPLDPNDAADMEDTFRQARAAVDNTQMSYATALQNLAKMGATKSPYFSQLAKKYGFDYAGAGYDIDGNYRQPTYEP